jgi:hypothetical protein
MLKKTAFVGSVLALTLTLPAIAAATQPPQRPVPTTRPRVRAPELDVRTAGAAIALLVGGALVVRESWHRRKRPGS